MDITAIDYPAKQKGLVVYHLMSMTENKRCRITVELVDNESILVLPQFLNVQTGLKEKYLICLE